MSVIKGLRAATARSPTTRKAVTVGTLVSTGGLAAGEDVQSVARKLSAVDRCIEILSDSMAKLPSFVIDNRSRERLSHDILYLLNVRPNEAMTPFARKKVLETSRLEGGNGYDWIIRDPSTGLPKELIPVPWQLVQQWHDGAGRIWYDITHPLTGELMRLANISIHAPREGRDSKSEQISLHIFAKKAWIPDIFAQNAAFQSVLPLADRQKLLYLRCEPLRKFLRAFASHYKIIGSSGR